MQHFPTAEGYVSVVEGKINYIYNYTNHLGNIRLSYGLDFEAQGQLKILRENHYYLYGLKHANYNAAEYQYKENELGTYVVLDPTNRRDYRYKCNAKEYQDELGLNLYDMDFRDYNPAIARWTGIDPVTHHKMSPYISFDGNPVFWADPSGADAIYNWDEHDNGNVDVYTDNRVIVSFTDAMWQHGLNTDGSDILFGGTEGGGGNQDKPVYNGSKSVRNKNYTISAFIKEHPFASDKIYAAKGQAHFLYNLIKDLTGGSGNNGIGDAAKHAFWMSISTALVGEKAA